MRYRARGMESRWCAACYRGAQQRDRTVALGHGFTTAASAATGKRAPGEEHRTAVDQSGYIASPMWERGWPAEVKARFRLTGMRPHLRARVTYARRSTRALRRYRARDAYLVCVTVCLG